MLFKRRNIKLANTEDQIFKKELFEIVVAHVLVVEFIKRGLPHIQLVLILKEGHKIKSGDQYDRFISAEIPDKYEYPILHSAQTYDAWSMWKQTSNKQMHAKWTV